MPTSLESHANSLKASDLLSLFKQNPQRAEEFSLSVGKLWMDYSKNHLTEAVLDDLCQMAANKGLPQAIDDLMSGKKVNHTEGRAAWHTALRQPEDPTEDKLIAQTLGKMGHFVEQLKSQSWKGYTGKPISTVVNIGIGGSDLGPRMVSQGLVEFQMTQPEVLFIANIDGADLMDTIAELNPETTLFIIASKSFSTLETLNNGLSARQWALTAGCPKEELYKHFVAISSNIEAASEFGIAEENIFPMWDWVGGRYSLWSAIGLPIALSIGMDNFKALLAGAHQMDQHFATAPLNQNMPVLAALISYFYSQYWGATTHAVLPYAQRLSRLPAYLQQLDMESLGKSVNRAGVSVNYPTGSVIWGTEGTNGQHSFHQLLHQGTQLIPVDFIAVKQPMSSLKEQHDQLLACCISQSQALLQGKTLAQAIQELRDQGLSTEEAASLAPHKVIPGNRPNNFILMEDLSPESLGALIAFYEHKVYATGVLLDLNPFDQWGVELGKQLGGPLYKALSEGEVNAAWDSSTQSIISKVSA